MGRLRNHLLLRGLKRSPVSRRLSLLSEVILRNGYPILAGMCSLAQYGASLIYSRWTRLRQLNIQVKATNIPIRLHSSYKTKYSNSHL